MLVHESIDVRKEVWTRLKVNAELSGAAVRDYLTYLVAASRPVAEEDEQARLILQHEARLNRQARQDGEPD